jgi:hypothetical protein
MGIFSGTKEKGKLTLVFNIGSSSVGGALFYALPEGTPKIIFSVNEPVKLEKNVDIDRILVLTLEALNIVASKIYKAGLGAPTAVFCVLSSPWYISQTRVISVKKDTPFVFSDKLADSLVAEEVKNFEKENEEKYQNIGKSVRIIELKNIKAMLNGYETAKPFGQKVKELELTIFISLSAEGVLQKIETTIEKYFHKVSIRFSSFAVAAFTVVRDMEVGKEDFLVLDIGGEITDISMVKKNILRESASFPLGRNFLIRGVAVALGTSLEEASSLITLYGSGHAEEETRVKMKKIMTDLGNEWLKKFQECLANLSNDISVPSRIYMANDKDLADFFIETIKTEKFSQYTLTESKFEVVFLDTKMLHGLARFEEAVIRRPFLIIDSIYINRFLIKI